MFYDSITFLAIICNVVPASFSSTQGKKETPPIGWCFFFGAGKFASQTYPAGELKSKGNRRYAASGGRSEPVSRKRRCLWFSKGHKQQCRDGVHPTKVPLANIPFLAGSRRLYILFRTHKAIEIGRPIGCPVSFWSGLSFCSVADCLWRKRKVAALK